MWGQILGKDSILMLTVTFSRVMHVSTRAAVSFASFIEQSAMYSGCDRGCGRDYGHDRKFGGRGSFRAGHIFTDGNQSTPDKGHRHCKHCRRSNHVSEKCWEKFGRPEWAQLVDFDPSALCDTRHVPSSAHPGPSSSFTVILSHEEYDRLRQVEFSHNSHSATHASASDMHAILSLLKSSGF